MLLILGLMPCLACAQEAAVRQVVVADFISADDDNASGATYADALRMKLGRLDAWDTVDAITASEAAGPLGSDAEQATLDALAADTGASLAIAGDITHKGETVTVTLLIADIDTGLATQPSFSAEGERAKAIITRAIVEEISGLELWTPPTLDEPEPEFTDPLNTDADFESESTPWLFTDDLTTVIAAEEDVEEDSGRGKVLIIRTDYERAAWIAYCDALASGDVDPDTPTELPESTGYDSVGGIDGIHVRSDWIAATPGQRYWLTADMQGAAGCNARIFIKGFEDVTEPVGMTETALRERDMTPDDLSAMDADARADLLAAELAEHPERYRRECYRWYLRCENTSGDWEHFAAPFPPRGGLPETVAWLRIDIFAAWPAGEYRFDNVALYAQPVEPDDDTPADAPEPDAAD